MQKIAFIGECMIEMVQTGECCYKQSFAGDTANTAIYFSRIANTTHQVSYITALSDDPYSQAMLRLWAAEKIVTEDVRRVPNQMPGLYLIQNNAEGERTFYYYRSNSPARALFDGEEGEALLEKLLTFDVWYFSGITVAILTATSQALFLKYLEKAKQKGIQICFDTNYRARLWPSQLAAQSLLNQVLHYVDIAMVSFSDEQELFGDETPKETMQRLEQLGVSEVVVKQGEKTGFLASGKQQYQFQPPLIDQVIDTTSAGDAFNAAYLAARFSGDSLEQAAKKGADLAGKVIQYRGAIIPAE